MVVPVAMGTETLVPLVGTSVMMVLVCPLMDMATGCNENGGGGCGGGGSGVVGEATADLGNICLDFFVAVAVIPRGVRSEECRVRPAIC